jgi:hypothetical protein
MMFERTSRELPVPWIVRRGRFHADSGINKQYDKRNPSASAIVRRTPREGDGYDHSACDLWKYKYRKIKISCSMFAVSEALWRVESASLAEGNNSRSSCGRKP